MTRLPSLKPKEVVRALIRAGFEEHHQRGSHLYLRHPGKKLITSVPMHAGDLKRGTLRAIISKAGMTVGEFLELL